MDAVLGIAEVFVSSNKGALLQASIGALVKSLIAQVILYGNKCSKTSMSKHVS